MGNTGREKKLINKCWQITTIDHRWTGGLALFLYLLYACIIVPFSLHNTQRPCVLIFRERKWLAKKEKKKKTYFKIPIISQKVLFLFLFCPDGKLKESGQSVAGLLESLKKQLKLKSL
jgi:hypothetical protein